MEDIIAMYLAGRCANGSELDCGTRWHALPNGLGWTALCGAKPGRRSAGWRGFPDEIHAVTCPRCLAKMSPNTACSRPAKQRKMSNH